MSSAADVEANKQVVESFLAALSAIDGDAAVALFAEDGTWEVVDHKTPVMSPTELGAAISGFAAMADGPSRFNVVGITAGDDRVAVEAENEVQLKNGRLYSNRLHFIFVLADGKIVAGREYLDTAQTAAAFAPVEAS